MTKSIDKKRFSTAWIVVVACMLIQAIPFGVASNIQPQFVSYVVSEKGFTLAGFSLIFTLGTVASAVASTTSAVASTTSAVASTTTSVVASTSVATVEAAVAAGAASFLQLTTARVKIAVNKAINFQRWSCEFCNYFICQLVLHFIDSETPFYFMSNKMSMVR